MAQIEYGKPTAKKVRDTGWYLPAVTTAFGPKVLPFGALQETRWKAVSEARRILAEAAPPQSTGGE